MYNERTGDLSALTRSMEHVLVGSCVWGSACIGMLAR